jgi:hypothetical protein
MWCTTTVGNAMRAVLRVLSILCLWSRNADQKVFELNLFPKLTMIKLQVVHVTNGHESALASAKFVSRTFVVRDLDLARMLDVHLTLVTTTPIPSLSPISRKVG